MVLRFVWGKIHKRYLFYRGDTSGGDFNSNVAKNLMEVYELICFFFLKKSWQGVIQTIFGCDSPTQMAILYIKW